MNTIQLSDISEVDPKWLAREYVELTNLCHNITADFTSDIFERKHFNNPFGKSIGYCAIQDNRMIGLSVFMRWEFYFSGKLVKAAQAVDSLIHPNHQGTGLYRKIQMACMTAIPEDVMIRFRFPNDANYRRLLNFGWMPLKNYQVKLYPIHWRRFIFTRVLRREKTFSVEAAHVSDDIGKHKAPIDLFLKQLHDTNITNYSYALLAWKLSLHDKLAIKLFWGRDTSLQGLMVYSICKTGSYRLLSVKALLLGKVYQHRHSLYKQIQHLIQEEAICEIQSLGNHHEFWDSTFRSVATKQNNVMIHLNDGENQLTRDMFNDVHLSGLVTDHC